VSPPTTPIQNDNGSGPGPSVPLLATKLAVPPPRPHRLPRPRLTARIDPGEPVRLTLVVAPPGFGKSTLLGAWHAENPDRPVAWVSLDPGDNDPARFLHYLLAALDGVHPGLAVPARSLLRSSPSPLPEAVLTPLLNGLAALPGRVTLALDDYHLIEATPVHEAVEYLLEHMPPTLHLVLASRADPPLHLARMRVRGQLSEIRAADLRFTVEEAAAFLREAMGLDLPMDLVERLDARTEGWVAGLQLAALTLQGREDPEAFVASFTGSHRYVVDYLADEVLENQPPPLREFMLKTSVLDRLCGPLCDAVTGGSDGQATLERMEAANLFLIPLDERREWYRYHHLFADVLRDRLRHETPGAAETLHARAAEWLEGAGKAGEAIAHALAARDWDRAARLIEREGDMAWRRGEQRTLNGWLEALPDEVVRSRPGLVVFLGRSYLYNGRFPDVPALLDTVDHESLKGSPEGCDTYGRLLVIRAHVARALEDEETSVRLTEEALENLSKGDGSIVWRSAASLNLALIHSQNGDLEPCVAALEETIRAGTSVGESHVTLLAMNFLAQMREQAGSLHEAEAMYRLILDYAEDQGLKSAPEATLAYSGIGRIRYARNLIPEARESLETGARTPYPDFAAYCHLVLARIQLSLGDRDGYQRTLSTMEAIVKEARAIYSADVMGPLRASADPTGRDAREWAVEFEMKTRAEVKRAFREPFMREFAYLTWGRVRLSQGRTEAVRSFAQAWVEEIEGQKRYGSAMEFRILLALAWLMDGREENALQAIRPALDLSEREGHLRPFLDAGLPMAQLLKRAAAEGVHPLHVGRFLQLFREGHATAPPPSESTAGPVDPLSDREIEVLRLVAAGLSNTEIADRLYLTVGTVKRHLYNIYSKLGAKRRTDALTRAREYRLLP
ncbi:MAG: LuxR C-terminal-related transcriptional regulator, partial [Armatimonadetes bacterium]|nr:LuxR C-terminal-related transcriptional regulator [Armatimonadota bacterium]